MRYVVLYPANQYIEASSDSVLELYSELEKKYGVGNVVAIHIAEHEDPFNPDNYAYYDVNSLKRALQQEREVEEIIRVAEHAGWSACIAPFGNLTMSICIPEFNDGADEVHVCVDNPYMPTNETMLQRVLDSLYEAYRNTRSYQALRRKNNPLAWDENVMADNQLLRAIRSLTATFEKMKTERKNPKQPSYLDDIKSVCREVKRRGFAPVYNAGSNTFAVYMPIDGEEDELILSFTYPDPVNKRYSFYEAVSDTANRNILTLQEKLKTYETLPDYRNRPPKGYTLTKVSALETTRHIRWLGEIASTVNRLKEKV